MFKIDPERLHRETIDTMLAVREKISQQLAKASCHGDRAMFASYIAEIDGYLTLQAPTDKVH